MVITLLVIGCSLASASSTFGFASVGGGLYCNYGSGFSNVFGPPFALWQGTDNLSACGHAYNATAVGIKGGLSAAGNPVGFGIATGTGITYADNIYDAFSYGYTGAQWDVTQTTKCSDKLKKYGWVGFAGASGIVFGDNYGFVTCTIPGKGHAPTKGPSFGNAKAPAKR
jgi:hypothetical protein